MSELVIALPTFRRPEALDRALTAVHSQVEVENARADARFTCTVLVIDNDPTGSGQQTASAHPARYVVETTPGIAAVRNRALAECRSATALVFIDDDEVPEDDWLANLIAMYLSSGATAVAGKVVTTFPPDVEPWVRASGAFVRPVRSHGQLMAEAATNNLLLDVEGVQRLGVTFDERFGLTGGSDSMFTRELTARGGTIRWADDAVVVEQEEAARFTRAWVLMRTFRFGNTAARVDIALAPPRHRALQRVRTATKGLVRIAGGGLRWTRGALSGSLGHRARGVRTIYRGAGMVAGATGYAHDEYGRRRSAT